MGINQNLIRGMPSLVQDRLQSPASYELGRGMDSGSPKDNNQSPVLHDASREEGEAAMTITSGNSYGQLVRDPPPHPGSALFFIHGQGLALIRSSILEQGMRLRRRPSAHFLRTTKPQDF